MIIYYHKKTGKIYGSILGRVHTEMELKPDLIQPRGVPQKDIARKIFNLKGTKELEKHFEKTKTHIMNYMVDVSDSENILLIPKPKELEPKPDSVETILIDLTKKLSEIEANFSKTTRQGIKKASDMTFREIGFNDRKIVYDVLEEVEDMKDIRLAKHILRIRAPFLDGFRKMYVVEDKEKRPLSVALITVRIDSFVYTLGGVTKIGRDTHAGDFLIWELIKDAKDLGYSVFDLGGIYADWASDKKKKVNVFKERWGGKREKMT